MRSWPCSQPLGVVPRKMTNVLSASARAVADPANPVAMVPTTVAAMTPLPALASFANRSAESCSASDRARARACASTQGTDTMATVDAHMIRPWPAANVEYAATSSRWVSSSAYP